ncbi:MAG TPA: hypothetical protein PLA68_06615 [Panacibacter sp.]|nr:hypothetical protein [Panacibacter sp.]
MYKKIFFHSIGAGILSAVACIIYSNIYFFATETDFSKILNTATLIGVNLAACLIAGTGFWVIKKIFTKNGDIIFNFTFTILSFASVMLPIAASLPLDVEYPELFPGLAVPMHFFPALAWFTLSPLFNKV